MIDGGGWSPTRAVVTAVDAYGPDCVRIELRPAAAVAAAAVPGQFVMVRVSENKDPLLRRPLSVHDVDDEGESLVLAVAVVGTGTRLLARARPGDELSMSGPHGRGFGPSHPDRRLVLIGGGIGAAPLLLAARIENRRVPVTVVLGSQTADRLLARDRFLSLGVTTVVATDDGSAGRKGTALDAAADILTPDCEVWACGPRPMLAATAALCADRRIPCRVAVETNFACGVGACYGCAIPRAGGGYLRACRDGPVFEAEEVAW